MPPRSTVAPALALLACASSEPPRVDLPNLVPVLRLPLVQERTFARDACEVVEGCTLPGDRRLLRFDLATPNVGPADLHVGSPEADGGARPEFEFAPCHNHWHLRGYADYRLLTMDGREVGRGHKQAFCLEDTDRYTANARFVADDDRFDCGNQGIHAGWMDVYGRNLACQYVDITGVPAGRYRLRASINTERRLRESRYDDNVAELVVEVPGPAADAGADAADAAPDVPPVDPTLPCAEPSQGRHRDCGWEAEAAARRCTPGQRVTAGCDRACGAPLGACMGDPMIRVCEGDRACADADAVASNDDACAGDGSQNPCSRVTFTCPPSGAWRVLTGAFRAGEAYQCRVAAE